MKGWRVYQALLAGLLFTGCVVAQDHFASVDASAPLGLESHRPKIGLVLSGGGARGAAHIGVLKALEELHVPIDAIAGSSIGAVVGGLYASGLSAEQIEKLLVSLDWADAFRDRASRPDLDFRRKEDDRDFLVNLPVGYGEDGFRFPRGLIQGQKLEAKLRSALSPVAMRQRFDELPIPFRAIATDLASGEAVVLDHGSLAQALRASMSVPGLLAPVKIDDRLLVDGGIAENLPVDVARAMGVDVVIVVDVTSPLQAPDQLKSPLAVSNQMIAILIGRATARARQALTKRDVYIRPELGSISALDFAHLDVAIKAGEAAVVAQTPLSDYELDKPRYLAYRQSLTSPEPAPLLEFVQVTPATGRYHKLIEAALEPAMGKPMTPALIDESLSVLNGRDLFQALNYQWLNDQGRRGILVDAQPKSWGPTFLHFALELQNDFRGTDSFNAGVRAVFTDVNPYLAEWRLDLKVGNQPKIKAEFFQPLGYASPWFIAPSANSQSRNVSLFNPDGTALADYRISERDFGIDWGRLLGSWGEFRIGVHDITGVSSLRIGTPLLSAATPPPGSFAQGGYFARFSVDQLDSVNFPRRGNSLVLEWDGQRKYFGANDSGDRAKVDWLIANSYNRDTLVFWASAGSALTALRGVQSDYTLGGFLNLSGLSANSLAGPHFAIARLVYFHKVSNGGNGLLEVPAYVGISTEAGNVWSERHDISYASSRKDGSLFLGLDTPLGPAYLGAGLDQGGHTSYYLFLGRTF